MTSIFIKNQFVMTEVNKAFEKINRKDFLPTSAKELADYDMPISIGFGQTNSQPTTVKMMLNWLEPQPGEKILDVGSGSGWTSALLAQIVGKNGHIYAVEKVPELVKFGRKNCAKYGFKNVEFLAAGNEFGLSKFAPYDRILVSAAADELPTGLIDQLKINGRLVVPVKNSVLVIDKTAESKYSIAEHSGFLFVPLIN
ncbi:MAG: protein-L-isoaspartate O-methyltransferase family protein [Candidatus Saccharimonadales bacterium]